MLGEQVSSIDADDVVEGLPRVLRRRAAFPTPTRTDGCLNGRVE